MAKKATGKAKTGGKSSTSKMVVARGGDRRQTSGRRSSDTAGDAFIKLLQSPLVAELVAVAATAALGALAQEGISGAGSGTKRAGNAVKRAGKAAAKAVGDRLKIEIDEVKKASKARAGAKA
jgi:hypothetical protein